VIVLEPAALWLLVEFRRTYVVHIYWTWTQGGYWNQLYALPTACYYRTFPFFLKMKTNYRSICLGSF